MTRPIRVEIDLSAIKHNYIQSRKQTQNRRALAVIKANAYGHGGAEVAAALADVADGFALLNLEDAVALRDAGIRHPLTLLEGPFDEAEARLMARLDIAGAIHSDHQVDWLSRLDPAYPFQAWLKVNSGMNRLGFTPDRVAGIARSLSALSAVRLTTLMTHFATADDARGVAEQWSRFEPLIAECGLDVSAANSAAIFRHPHTHGNTVRPGITLYGCSPFEGSTGADLGLKPAMRLSADIIAVQSLRRGDNVGYGCLFQAPEDLRIGIVACGYADGYPRTARTGTPVCVDGVAAHTVGRVSMDMLAIDLSHAPAAGIGSRVELWGAAVPLEGVAAGAGTLNYELMCAIAPRVPRLYRH